MSNPLSPIVADVLMDGLGEKLHNFVPTSIYVFSFRDLVIEFPDGLPTGHLFSPLVADVLMKGLGEKLFTEYPTTHDLL